VGGTVAVHTYLGQWHVAPLSGDAVPAQLADSTLMLFRSSPTRLFIHLVVHLERAQQQPIPASHRRTLDAWRLARSSPYASDTCPPSHVDRQPTQTDQHGFLQPLRGCDKSTSGRAGQPLPTTTRLKPPNSAFPFRSQAGTTPAVKPPVHHIQSIYGEVMPGHAVLGLGSCLGCHDGRKWMQRNPPGVAPPRLSPAARRSLLSEYHSPRPCRRFSLRSPSFASFTPTRQPRLGSRQRSNDSMGFLPIVDDATQTRLRGFCLPWP
jgi:hypothetical protein